MRKRRITFAQLEAELGSKAVPAAKAALSSIADDIVKGAQSRCPERTGTLKNSIHKEVLSNGERVKVVADAKAKDGTMYGKLVEFSPKINKPFLYPAVDAVRDEIGGRIADNIRKALKG